MARSYENNHLFPSNFLFWNLVGKTYIGIPEVTALKNARFYFTITYIFLYLPFKVLCLIHEDSRVGRI